MYPPLLAATGSSDVASRFIARCILKAQTVCVHNKILLRRVFSPGPFCLRAAISSSLPWCCIFGVIFKSVRGGSQSALQPPLCPQCRVCSSAAAQCRETQLRTVQMSVLGLCSSTCLCAETRVTGCTDQPVLFFPFLGGGGWEVCWWGSCNHL